MNLTVTAKDDKMTFVRRSGGMADAHGSGPCGSNTVWVQVPSSALQYIDAGIRRVSALFLYKSKNLCYANY